MFFLSLFAHAVGDVRRPVHELQAPRRAGRVERPCDHHQDDRRQHLGGVSRHQQQYGQHGPDHRPDEGCCPGEKAFRLCRVFCSVVIVSTPILQNDFGGACWCCCAGGVQNVESSFTRGDRRTAKLPFRRRAERCHRNANTIRLVDLSCGCYIHTLTA